MTFKRSRLIFQLVFFGLFIFLLIMTGRGHVSIYPVRLFLDMSLLSGLVTIISQHNLAGGMLLGVLLGITGLFLGRFFCGWICPMGSCQHLSTAVFREKEKIRRYQKNSWTGLLRLKYLVLGVVLVCALAGVTLSGWLDPLSLITRFFATVILPLGRGQTLAFSALLGTGVIFLAAFFLNAWRSRFWCRYICPLGAVLGIFSLRPLLRISRDTETCTDCGLCREACHGACEVDKEIIPSDCLMCMNCLDACPHNALEYRYVWSGEKTTVPVDTGRSIRVSRRGWFAAAVSAISIVAVFRNLKNVLYRGFPSRIRPPGSLSERDFLSRCVRCGECMAACPTNVLQPCAKQSDLEAAQTPVLDMKYGYCDYECNNCSVVCPTRAIRPYPAADKHSGKHSKIGTAFFDRNRCLPWALGKPCLVCQEVCPVSPKAIFTTHSSFTRRDSTRNAIELPYVDAEKCIGCGACEFNCPVQDLPGIRVTSIGEIRSEERRLIL